MAVAYASKVPEHSSKALMYPCLRKDGRCLCVESARARIQNAHVSMFAQGWPLPMRRKCPSTHPECSCIHVCARMAVAYGCPVGHNPIPAHKACLCSKSIGVH